LAAKYGFEAIEVFYKDLEYVARLLAGTDHSPTDFQLLNAAAYVKALCDSLRLTVLGLHPFFFYESLIDREEHIKLVYKMKV
jgi:4-hydroxyphenylpyruvate dioxygenase